MASTATESPAPFATLPNASRGRHHDEPPAARRDPFEIDRHRVIASTAFRRLQYKTQVFVYDEHDHFRTRLTHTLEVAQIARRLAVALSVNERLAEAVALAHDLGHPPFGHAGEATLRELMAGAGGFEHNTQALRIVEFLEHPHPEFRGLNLTYELREGLIKHHTEYDRPDPATAGGLDIAELIESGPHATIEAQLVSIADRVAYDCHDLDDAIGARLITDADLNDVALWNEAAADVRRRHPTSNLFATRRPILDALLDFLLSDCESETRRRLDAMGKPDSDDVRNAPQPSAAFSADVLPPLRELEGFLAERVYRHHRLVRMDAKARRFIERLFNAYAEDPAMLPPRFASRIDAQGPRRVVCDYIAGMTDRFCQDEYARLFQPHERV